MLKDPPCIRRLVGCLGSDYVGGGGDATVGLTLGGSSRSSSSDSVQRSASAGSSSLGSEVSSSVRSTLGDLSARLPSFASGTLIGRSAKLYTARYVIKAKNVGSQALQGVKISHGPLPFGAEFDSQKSDRSCFLNAKTVECSIDLASGVEKELSLVYKAGGSMSCAFARLLEKAKATIQSVTGSANANLVVTTVTCRMESIDAPTQGSLNNSSVFGTGLQTARGTGTVVGSNGFKDSGYKQGYKQYVTVLPRTGVLHDYFASVGVPKTMIIQRHTAESSFSMIPVTLLSLVSIVAVFVLLKRSLRYFGR